MPTAEFVEERPERGPTLGTSVGRRHSRLSGDSSSTSDRSDPPPAKELRAER